MKSCASVLILVMLATFLDAGAEVRAQFTDEPQQFFGTPSGWAFDPERPATSTRITSQDASGFLLFFCEAARPAFFAALGANEDGEAHATHDGLLQVHPASGRVDYPLLAQFPVRLLAPHALRSTRFLATYGDPPRRLLELVRDYPTGIRLTVIPLRHDVFTPPRLVDIFLPGTADETGLPMELALASLLEACRRQSAR
jgi:hypothetical protein